MNVETFDENSGYKRNGIIKGESALTTKRHKKRKDKLTAESADLE
jgi:hypothetical protein